MVSNDFFQSVPQKVMEYITQVNIMYFAITMEINFIALKKFNRRKVK